MTAPEFALTAITARLGKDRLQHLYEQARTFGCARTPIAKDWRVVDLVNEVTRARERYWEDRHKSETFKPTGLRKTARNTGHPPAAPSFDQARISASEVNDFLQALPQRLPE